MSATELSSGDPGAQTPGRPGQRRDIQGIRAIAVLMVVAFHSGLPVPGGFVGVDVFFVISGFVITAMLRREWKTYGRIRLARFYLRRFKRLTPALALTVGVTSVVAFLVLSPLGTQQTTAKTGLGALVLAANVVIARTTGGYFDAPAETNALLNTWSLSVEEQFYLVFPLVLLLGWRLSRRNKAGGIGWASAIVAVIAVGSFALALLGSSNFPLPLPPKLVYLADLALGFYSPLARAWEFALGALIALAGSRLVLRSSRLSALSGALGLALVVASLWIISESRPTPGVWTLLPVLGTALLIVAGHGTRPSGTSLALAASPLVRVGDWSYSIYLWHWPAVVFANALWPHNHVASLSAAVLSFIPAIASYYLVEQPIRASQVSRGLPLFQLVALTLIPPLILSATLAAAADRGFWNAEVRHYQGAISPDHAGEASGCSASLPWEELDDCTWNQAGTGAPIYLVGDSHADHFSEAVIRASEDLDRPLENLGVKGCAYSSKQDPGSLCDRIYVGVRDHLAQAQPGLVILANLSADSTLDALSRQLLAAGHKVLLVQAVPVFEEWRPDSCSVPTIVRGNCSRTQTVETALHRQAHARSVLTQVASSTGVAVLDPWPVMCPSGTCSTSDGTLIRYRDSDHITVAQSETLAPVFRDAIVAASLTSSTPNR